MSGGEFDETYLPTTAGLCKSQLTETFDDKARPLLDLIDELRWQGIDSEINLPAIVVVGDQSSGKSSILEALSQIELPKGQQMVTKCPLIIQMKKTVHESISVAYNGKKEKIICENIMGKIREAQDEIVNGENTVKNIPITLKLFSPNAADLTLIDLPGLTRTEVDGQPADMPEQIRELALEYLNKENILILCVIEGPIDYARNEAVKLAREVDPDGNKTIGVITKCDQIDDEDVKIEKLDLFNGGKRNALKKFVMVKCRSAQNIKNGCTLEKAIHEEKMFFENDPVLRKADKTWVGIPALSRLLTRSFAKIIADRLPGLRTEITKLLTTLEENWKEYCPQDEKSFKKSLSEYREDFWQLLRKSLIHGKVESRAKNAANTWRTYFEEFSGSIEKLKNDFMSEKITLTYCSNEIDNTKGRKPDSTYITYRIMKKPCLKHFENYETAATDCLEKVVEDVKCIIDVLIKEKFGAISNCIKIIQDTCENCLEERQTLTKENIKNHLKEEGELFTQARYLNAEKDSIKQTIVNEETNPEKLVHLEKAKEIQLTCHAYLNIAVRRFSDQIPSCIYLSFNEELVNDIRSKLRDLFEEEEFFKMAQGGPERIYKRNELENKIYRLKEAKKELHHFS